MNLLLKTRPGTRYEEHRTEEAFDYANRALLYLERRLPEPTRRNAEEYARLCALRTAELLEASRGRALVLLSTARAVGLFREYLDVPYPVRYKTDGAPTGPLVEWLKSTPGAVLVGTRSLWEGVDIVGPQVSLVVIDKVPFAAPNYPVNKAITERAGADWFRLVSPPRRTWRSDRGPEGSSEAPPTGASSPSSIRGSPRGPGAVRSSLPSPRPRDRFPGARASLPRRLDRGGYPIT